MRADFPAVAATSTIEPALATWQSRRDAWRELHAVVPCPTIFLSPAWVDAWLAVFGTDLNPEIWTVRIGNTIVGAALLVRRTEWRGPVPMRCLYLNTAGEGSDSVTLEHNRVLIRPEYEEIVWRELGVVLRGLQWDELLCHGCDMATAERLTELFPNWATQMAPRAAPFVNLEAVRTAPDGLLDLLSTNSRSTLRRAMRAAAEQGPVHVDEGTTPALREQLWQDLKRLHTYRWRRQNLPGAFSQARWMAFHEQLQLAAPASVRLFRLRLGDQTAAALYLLQHEGHVAFYQSGVRSDPSHARTKPGLLLHAKVIERLAAEGNTEYDFLASEEPEVRYKRSLSSHERTLWWGAVLRPSWRTWLTAHLRRLRRRARSFFRPRSSAQVGR